MLRFLHPSHPFWLVLYTVQQERCPADMFSLVSQVQAMHPHSCWWHSVSFQGVMEHARTAGSVKTECCFQEQRRRFHNAADYQPEDKGAMCWPQIQHVRLLASSCCTAACKRPQVSTRHEAPVWHCILLVPDQHWNMQGQTNQVTSRQLVSEAHLQAFFWGLAEVQNPAGQPCLLFDAAYPSDCNSDCTCLACTELASPAVVGHAYAAAMPIHIYKCVAALREAAWSGVEAL